jgi:hypothetical protein
MVQTESGCLAIGRVAGTSAFSDEDVAELSRRYMNLPFSVLRDESNDGELDIKAWSVTAFPVDHLRNMVPLAEFTAWAVEFVADDIRSRPPRRLS